MSTPSLSRRQLTPLEPLIGAVEAAEGLDEPARAVAKSVRQRIPAGAVKDALSGTWLGHAVHPLLTDVVIGSFTSATVLDVLGGGRYGDASERLIATGILAYAPTALTGTSDWADAEPVDSGVRRAGLVHAAAPSGALTLYGSSLWARRRGGSGRLLGALGMVALGAGGYLGAHLSFSKGIGPDQTVFDQGPQDWTPAVDAAGLPDGEATRAVAGDTPVLLLRLGERIHAIHDRCSHRGCSLSEGEIAGEEVVCGCHGSRFSLTDGAVRRGPATAAQPAFEARERDGVIEVRRQDST